MTSRAAMRLSPAGVRVRGASSPLSTPAMVLNATLVGRSMAARRRKLATRVVASLSVAPAVLTMLTGSRGR
eukprot:scaffold8307_cov71-Phaeocystis_antarctica.AAC.6